MVTLECPQIAALFVFRILKEYALAILSLAASCNFGQISNSFSDVSILLCYHCNGHIKVAHNINIGLRTGG